MKKNNSYLADNEIDLANIIKSLWKEKILILCISIIGGLLVYFYALLKPQEFKSEIILNNPPVQIFEPYTQINNINKDNVSVQFISNLKLNFLSLDNLQSFLEESREFDNFKVYLKSRNISAKQYFSGQKFGEVKDKNIIIPNKYFINHPKELDGAIFLHRYVEFIKEKTITELKNSLKLTFLNTINNHQEALEIAKKIQLEIPIFVTIKQQQILVEPTELIYKGTKVLSENINFLNKRLIKLENDEFDYNIIHHKFINIPHSSISLFLYFALGLMLGLFLSLVIIYLKNVIK